MHINHLAYASVLQIPISFYRWLHVVGLDTIVDICALNNVKHKHLSDMSIIINANASERQLRQLYTYVYNLSVCWVIKITMWTVFMRLVECNVLFPLINLGKPWKNKICNHECFNMHMLGT